MKAKLKWLLTCLIICNGIQLSAQEVLSTSGDHLKNASGSVSFTVGEIMTDTYKAGNSILTQGFHQTNLVAVAIHEARGLDYEVSVFPNPAKDYLILKINAEQDPGRKFMLFNMGGTLLLEKQLTDTETEISFIGLPPLTYILKILDGRKTIKTFKIVKQ